MEAFNAMSDWVKIAGLIVLPGYAVYLVRLFALRPRRAYAAELEPLVRRLVAEEIARLAAARRANSWTTIDAPSRGTGER